MRPCILPIPCPTFLSFLVVLVFPLHCLQEVRELLPLVVPVGAPTHYRHELCALTNRRDSASAQGREQEEGYGQNLGEQAGGRKVLVALSVIT